MSSNPECDREVRYQNLTSHHHQNYQFDLLKHGQLAHIHGVEASRGHGTHHHEHAVPPSYAFCWIGRAPENEAPDECHADEVRIVQGDEIYWRQVRLYRLKNRAYSSVVRRKRYPLIFEAGHC
jgi:hypothetical protein